MSSSHALAAWQIEFRRDRREAVFSFCTRLNLLMSAFGTKRTTLVALHMSAFGTKRTSATSARGTALLKRWERLTHPLRCVGHSDGTVQRRQILGSAVRDFFATQIGASQPSHGR